MKAKKVIFVSAFISILTIGGFISFGFTSNNKSQGQCIANAGPDKTICCPGGQVTIGGNPTASGGTCGATGYCYTWSPATGLSSTTIANPIANPTVTTTYAVYIKPLGCSPSSCCDASDNVVVTVNGSCCR